MLQKLPIERFREKIDKTNSNGCWIWVGAICGGYRKNGEGYGNFRNKGKVVYAHRWSYEHFVGPIPEGLQIDHFIMNKTPDKCSRVCVNPDHLEVVTRSENAKRSEKLKKACRKSGRLAGLSTRIHNLPEGVTFNRKRFRARITVNGKCIRLGTYDTPEEASRVYQEARKKMKNEG